MTKNSANTENHGTPGLKFCEPEKELQAFLEEERLKQNNKSADEVSLPEIPAIYLTDTQIL